MSTPPTESKSDEGLKPTEKGSAAISENGIEANDRPKRTITRSIINPRLEIGRESFAGNQIGSAQIHLHQDSHSEFRSASVTLSTPFQGRWDYHSEVRIYEDDDLILTGICSEAKPSKGGRFHLKLWGPSWQLERTALRDFGTFGMSNKENFYWIAKMPNPTKDPVVEGLELDDTLRPFMFAIPLKNLKSSGKGLLLTADTGIASHEYENVFKPILAQFKEIEGEPAWSDENPKVFGVVFAENLLQADLAARDRAELTVGVIGLALRTGMSHFETRYGGEPLAFDAEQSLTPVSLHPWIIVREVSQVKGWIRKTPTANFESHTSLDDSLDRIRCFLSEFNRASEPGDVHDQLGRRQLSARERRLLLGTKRSLRWLNTASSEIDLRDSFTATWIALESILNAITYPGVFDGMRSALRDEIRREVRMIDLPTTTHESLAITTDMLENRILQNNWSLPRKLPIFSESLGIECHPDDKRLVAKLSRTRNTILHEGDDGLDLSQEQVTQLRHLVERLIVAVSIGGYEDLEDATHEFRIGAIGPEGGGAPVSIDGKQDVPYVLRGTRNAQGHLVCEWIAEGKIYSEENMRIV